MTSISLQRLAFAHLVIAIGALGLTGAPSFAGSFTPGNVIVQQADNGAIQNTTITVVEVNTAGSGGAAQSFSLPGTAFTSTASTSQAFRINGSGGTSGYLANSNDGSLLCIAAANALSSADLGQTTAASILNRAVIALGPAGSASSTLPATSYTGVSGKQCRGATSTDDVRWYIADGSGIYTNGGTSPSPSANPLAAKSFGGTVYVSTASSLSTVSAPSGSTLVALPMASGSTIPSALTDFSLISSGTHGAAFDILYVTNGASATSGTIYKYSLVGTTWKTNGSTTTTFGSQAIAGATNGAGGATLFVTSGNGGTAANKVYQLADTAGYNTAISITPANDVLLYTFGSAPTGKGIAFAPVSAPTIVSSGTLAAVNTTYGSVSASPTSFTVLGAALQAGVTVTPPTGFQVSTTSNFSGTIGTNASPLTIGGAGQLASTTIYLALQATAPVSGSPYSGNVVLASTGATTVNVATAPSTVTPAVLTVTANNATKVYGNTLTSGSGFGLTYFTSSGLAGTDAIDSVSITYGTGSAAGDPVNTYVGSVVPSAATGVNFAASNYSITYAAGNIVVTAGPTINVAGTLAALGTIYGTPSSASSFTASGSGLNGNLTVTAPSGFEVSSTSATAGFSGSVPLTQNGGTVGSTTIYVRLAAAANVVNSPYAGASVTVSGGGATTQPVSIPSSTVSPAPLTITGLAGVTKIYDGTTAASLSGTAAYAGLVNGDVLSVTGTPSANFGSALVAATVSITVTGYTAPNVNYTVNQPTGLSASITAKPLTVSNAAVTTKTYDGTTAAVITGTLTGVVSPDVVTLVGVGTFASANDGTGISVTSNSSLSGANTGNYSLTQPTGLTGTILPSANLSNLTLSAGTITPVFAPATTAYTAGESNDVASLTVTATADPSATLTVNGSPATSGVASSPISLSVGANNVVTVVATAQGGSASQTYLVTVTRAAPFTPGNLVVQQADNGSIQNTTITLVEVNSGAGATQESPVQTIQLPGTNVTSSPLQALRINGSGGTTGYLATTADGTLLAVAAADATGSADLAQTTPASIVNREVVTMNASGNLAFQASYTGGSGNQCRAATSLDDSNWFVADKGGIYVCSAASSPTTPDSTSNMLDVRPFGGVVYAITGSGLYTVASSGSHIGTLTALPGIPTSLTYTDFYLISSGVNGAGFDVCYVCNGGSATSGTIYKYSLVGGTWTNNVNSGGSWTANGTYATAFGGRSMVAAGSGAGAVLYLAGGNGGTSGTSVVEVTDTAGYNQTISVVTANNLNLYTFPGGTTGPVPKGIAFAPVSSALPDLTISAALPSNPYFPSGNQFSYQLTLANSGAANANGVTAQFTLPTGLTYVGSTDNGGSATHFTAANTGGVITFSGGALSAGTTDTITVNVSGPNGSYIVDAGAAPGTGHGSAIINTAAIATPPIAESNSANNSSSVSSVAVLGSVPYLTVSVSGSSTAVADSLTSPVTYVLTVQNLGNAAATGACVQFTLPAGLVFVSGVDTGSAGFTVSTNIGVVTFKGGTLAAGATETLTVTATASTSTYRIYSVNLPAGAAVVTASNATGSNSSTGAVPTSVTLPTGPDLVVTSTPNGPFLSGDPADTFTIYVSNDGTAATTAGALVTVTQTLPAGLTPAASMNGTNVNGWAITVSGQIVTATRSDSLAFGSGYPPLIVTVAVSAAGSGFIADNLTVSGGGDAFPANGTAKNQVYVGPASPISNTGYLLVSRGHYTGADIVAGSTVLPNGALATASGSYPGVWGNDAPDVSFGVTAPIYLDLVNVGTGSVINSTNVTWLIENQLGVDVTTSFSSKSEIGLNVTPDGNGVTFSGYLAPAGTLDVSNANTPYHEDPTSPLSTHGDYQKAVVQLDYLGNVQVTPDDSYSGDNCRAALLAQAGDGNYYYYMAGSAGNSGTGVTGATMSMLAGCTGIQMIPPGAGGLATAVGYPWGTFGSATGYQLGYAGLPTEKTGKDMNLRGLTLNPYNQTLYASKGSGGSGVDTIYQIGSGGLPTAANASTQVFTIPAGLPAASGSGMYPFGMWFANASTLYVGDEGQANVPTPATYSGGNYVQALPANNPNAGLQKWTNSKSDGTGTWSLAYVVNTGLNLGVPYGYAITNYPTGVNSATGVPWQPCNNGLRNITGQNNGDGSVTIYAVTSTVSGETDQGADPNQLVAITDYLTDTAPRSGETFTVIEEAAGFDTLRGVALSTPTMPLNVSFGSPSTVALNSNGYVAKGLTLESVALGFAPTPGQVLTLVNNTGTGPVVGAFTGLPEGSTVAATYGGVTYYFTISYLGGDGNDVTLTLIQPVPSGVELKGSTGYRHPASRLGRR